MDSFVRRILQVTLSKQPQQQQGSGDAAASIPVATVLQVALECVQQPLPLHEVTNTLLAPSALRDSVSVCTAAASVARSMQQKGEEVAEGATTHTDTAALAAFNHTAVSVLTAQPPYDESVVECFAICTSHLLSMALNVAQIRCVTMFDKAIQSLSVSGDGVDFPIQSALVFLGQLVNDLLLSKDERQAAATTNEMTPAHAPSSASVPPMLLKTLLDGAIACLSREQLDSCIPAVVTRRLLIPLLVQQTRLFQSHDALQRTLTQLLHKLVDNHQEAEAVVLIAGLFDFFFQDSSLNPLTDMRFQPFVWSTLQEALRRALDTQSYDAGKRMTLQLQVLYLLKRFVAMTDEQLQGTTERVVFHPSFVWVPSPKPLAALEAKPNHHQQNNNKSNNNNNNKSKAGGGSSASSSTTKEVAPSVSAWEDFFLMFETLNEFGLHINVPALAKLEGLLEQYVPRAFSIEWTELLLIKLVSHANCGVRKVGLRKIWALPSSVLSLLSRNFICKLAFSGAADVRLCTDVDRVWMPTNFLECKVLDGRPDRTLPVGCNPLVEQMESFYKRFVESLTSPLDVVDVLIQLLRCVDNKTTRFTVTALMRVLWHISRYASLETLPWNEQEGCFTPSFCDALRTFVKDAVQDHHPPWLEIRLNALVVDMLVALAEKTLLRSAHSVNAATETNFRRLLSLCGTLGDTGGRSLSVIDSCGTFGSVGSALPLASLLQRVGQSPVLREWLAAPAVIEKRMEEFLSSSQPTVAWAKELLQFVPLLCDTNASSSDDRGKTSQQEVVRQVVSTVQSLGTRPYATSTQYVAGSMAYAELFRVFAFDHPLLPEEGALLELLQAQLANATQRLRAAEQAISTVQTLESHSYKWDLWSWMQTEEWDCICAALFATLTRLLMLPTPPIFTDSLVPTEVLRNLTALLHSVVAMYPPQQQQQGESVAQRYTQIIVSRNAAKLLHSYVGAFAAFPAGTLARYFGDEPVWAMDQRVALFQSLSECVSLHLSGADVPCSLTIHTWGTILAQLNRYVYNTMHVLFSSSSSASSSSRTGVPPLLVRLAEEFATNQLDKCSTSNLSSLFDMMSLVLRHPRCEGDSGTFEFSRESVVQMLMGRMDDTQRREYFRCMALTLFSLVQCDDDDFVIATVTEFLNDETESERVIFMVCVVVAFKVLSDVERNWATYRDTLFHIAVLFNTGRDEEELEACAAASEPLFALWPQELRSSCPPSVRLAALGRSLILSTILLVCRRSSQRAIDFSLFLVEQNTANKTIKHEPCMPNSKTHRSRIRLWQLLCALLPALNPEEDWRALIALVMQQCMPINNMGSVRRFMELYLIGAFQRNVALYPLLTTQLDDYTLRPQVLGSYALVAVHVVLKRQLDQPRLFDELFPRIARLASSNQHLLRIISHIGLHRTVKDRRAALPHWSPNPEVAALVDFIDKAPESLKFREKHEDMVLFDCTEALSPRQLFCVQRKETNVWLRESLPAASFERIRFLHAELQVILGAVTPMEVLRVHQMVEGLVSSVASQDALRALQTLDLIPHAPAATRGNMYVDYTLDTLESVTLLDETLTAQQAEVTDNIQRKVTSWWNTEVYNELHPRALGNNTRQSIIMVASLLENPVNIAGLCRCGEIFTIERVVVPDKKVFEHPHFAATARSAELWMPWEEVHPLNLIPYLLRMRDEGYRLVGVEQTSSSVSMATYEFPSKTVILLGSEGQGIPAPILPHLDDCVEIPQYGLIRSLNVHVTGAIAMYEFTKQHLMSKQALGAQHPANIPGQ